MVSFNKILRKGTKNLRLFPGLPIFGEMPCEPSGIMPIIFVSFGNCEMEHMAPSLLHHSIRSNEWVGVSWRDFALDDSLKGKIIKALPPRLHYMTRFPSKEVLDADLGIRYHNWRGCMTRLSGFDAFIVDGINSLIKNGYVALVHEKDEDIICPTPKIVQWYLDNNKSRAKWG